MASLSNFSTPDDMDRPSDSDAAGASGGINLLEIAARRWDLLLVGLLAGLAIGVLYHVQRQPIYQSAAQVLVIKRSAEMTGRGDSRVAALEDVVSTQVTLLKSEHILFSAGKRLDPAELGIPLAADERDRAGMLSGGLSVARDRDSAVPGAPATSGILNLSFRSISPHASQKILEAVIQAYQAELSFLYDEATRTRMKTLDDVVRALQRAKEEALARKGERSDEMRRITEEPLGQITVRASARHEKQQALEFERVSVEKQIDQIKAAGRDRRKRIATLAQLTAGLRTTLGDKLDPSNPDIMIRTLLARREEKAEQLGPDHPEIKSLDNQIRFYRKLYYQLNPDAAEGDEHDELWAVEQRLIQQKATIDDQLELTRVNIRADRDIILSAGKLQDEIIQLTEKASALDKDINDRKKELVELEATQSSGGYNAQVITKPNVGWKVSPVLYQSLFVGLVIGGGLGCGLVFLKEVTDLGFKSPAEVRKRLGLPVLGHMPRLPVEVVPEDSPYVGLDPRLVVVHKPTQAEVYRGIRTQLYFSTQGAGHQLIQVTSPNPGDGKSTLASNLACTIAQSGKRTLLVDCDLRRPRVHKVFNLPKSNLGIASAVAGTAALEDGIQPSGVLNLDILPCGSKPGNPSELLTSPAFVEVLDRLRKMYDFVILDTPPMLPVSDPAVVAPRVDGVILVVRLSNRARPAAGKAKELLTAVGANIIGVAVNGGSGKAGQYGYGYGYGYQYAYQYEYEYADTYVDVPEEGGELVEGEAIPGRPPAKG